MPLQNRVTPFSTIQADPARGMFMGNRGCLHGEHRNLEVEHTREKRWLVCLTSFKGRKRRIMQPPGKRANAETLDKYLASDRLRPWPATFGELPEGTMFAIDTEAFVKWRGKAWRWHHAGYTPAEIPTGTVEVLTPEGTVAALAAGYKPVVHASAR